MERLHFNTYSELMQFMNENDDVVENILYYEDCFAVNKIGDQYFYNEETTEGPADEFYEVELVAELKYNILHDFKSSPDIEASLNEFFDCDCCGEYVHDNGISYLWFKEVTK